MTYHQNFSEQNIKKSKTTYKKISTDDQDYSLIKDYSLLLLSPPWRKKRKEIIKRDHFKCNCCGANETLNSKGVYYTSLKHYGFNERGKALYTLVNTHTPISLHVHHKLYVLDRFPWDYPTYELITLCHICHTKEHEMVNIPVFKTEHHKRKGESSKVCACWKCGGDGYLPEFSYHDNGVCYACDGIGFLKSI